MNHGEPVDRVAKLIGIGSRLAIDTGTVAVTREFEHSGVPFRLLKGPAIVQWLYPENGSRTYVDCDLLVAPTDIAKAENVLGSLGFERQFDDREMPAWWREHAVEWSRARDGVTVDLHRTLPGVGVDHARAWRALSAETDFVVVAGQPVLTLAVSGRALHVALHAAQHGTGRAQPVADLARALAISSDEVWARAAVLAAELDAGEAFAAGLRLVPAGAGLAGRLGLARVRSVDAKLRASSPPPLALGFEQLARAGGMRERAEIVARKLVPPAVFIRHWDSRAAAGGRWALLRGYLRRAAWLVCRTPRGLIAWWRAWRAVRRAGGV